VIKSCPASDIYALENPKPLAVARRPVLSRRTS
jgi:hypothetical protein